MEVKAVEKFIRISPKKARLVADVVRGKNAKASLHTLNFTDKKAAKIIYKAVRSAIANAENNNHLDGDLLTIKGISIDSGPSLKRFRPRSRGMAHHIIKRTSHITVILSDEVKPIKGAEDNKTASIKAKSKVKQVEKPLKEPEEGATTPNKTDKEKK
jgi:large subunit ribosomal protein L22